MDPELPGSPVTAAGWYDDPLQEGRSRYWDGERWTDHVASDRPGGAGWRARARPLIFLGAVLAALGVIAVIGLLADRGTDTASTTTVSSNIVDSTSPPPTTEAYSPLEISNPEALADALVDALPAGTETDPYSAAVDVIRLCRNIQAKGEAAVQDDKNLANLVYGAHGETPDEYYATRRMEIRVACPVYLQAWDTTPATN